MKGTVDGNALCRDGVQDRNAEGQMVVNFVKRTEMAVVNRKRKEYRMIYKNGRRCTRVASLMLKIQSERHRTLQGGVSGNCSSAASDCRMTLEINKRKQVKSQRLNGGSSRRNNVM